MLGSHVTCMEADVLDVALPAGRYDAVTSISALHHMPLVRRLLFWRYLLVWHEP